MGLFSAIFGKNKKRATKTASKTSLNTGNTVITAKNAQKRRVPGFQGSFRDSIQTQSQVQSPELVSQDEQLSRFYLQAISTIYGKYGLRGTASVKDVRRGARHVTASVRLTDETTVRRSISDDMTRAIGLRVKSNNVSAYDADGFIRYMFELPETWWQEYDWQDVMSLNKPERVIGFGEGHMPIQYIVEAPTMTHHLVAGTSGSGKSTTMAAMMLSAMIAYKDPKRLQFVVIDPNSDFSSIQGSAFLAGNIVDGSNQSFHSDSMAALDYAYNTMLHRKHNGIRFDRNVELSQLPPRTIVVIDELTGDDLLDSADARLRQQMLARLGPLAKQGRKYGVNLLVGLQDANKKQLPVINMFNTRWVGLVSSAQDSAHLTGHPSLNCQKLTKHGDFHQVKPGGRVVRFQVAKPDEADYESHKLPMDKGFLRSFAEMLKTDFVSPQSPDNDVSDIDGTQNYGVNRASDNSEILIPTGGSKGGRPSNSLDDSRTIAYYLAHTNAITASWAIANLAVKTDYHHTQYKNKALEIKEHLSKIVAAQRNK